MQIDIVYDSCWQNSFLFGDDNKPLTKDNDRKFKATSKSNVIDNREITESTILGILCRLIGDQRKLYQARQADDFYFKNIENAITFSHHKPQRYTETAYIINKSESRPSQSSFIGVLPDDTPLFFSNYALNIWSVLDMSFYELLTFIQWPDVKAVSMPLGHASPKNILLQLDRISAIEPHEILESRVNKFETNILKEIDKVDIKRQLGKKVSEKELEKIERIKMECVSLKNSAEEKELDVKIRTCVDILKKHFQEKNYISEKNYIYPMSLYAAALYLMLDELKRKGILLNDLLNKNGNIQGFNPYGFNGVRDFLNRFAGGQKRSGGTPTKLTKASGELQIKLAISKDKAEQLAGYIEAAGVSSFYLGKKGLAYVSHISCRE